MTARRDPHPPAETRTQHSSHMIRATETQRTGDESAIKKHAQAAGFRGNK